MCTIIGHDDMTRYDGGRDGSLCDELGHKIGARKCQSVSGSSGGTIYTITIPVGWGQSIQVYTIYSGGSGQTYYIM